MPGPHVRDDDDGIIPCTTGYLLNLVDEACDLLGKIDITGSHAADQKLNEARDALKVVKSVILTGKE